MIVCSNCGHENEDRADFCGSCGAFLEFSGKRVQETPPPKPAPKPASRPVTSSGAASPGSTSSSSSDSSTSSSGPASTPSTASTASTSSGTPGAAGTSSSTPAPPAETPAEAPAAKEPTEEERKKAEADARARALVTRPTAVTPASRAEAPPRSSVSSSGSQLRQPNAQQPNAQQPKAQKPAAMVRPKVPPKPPAPKGRQFKPGDRICGECGEGNDRARKFCHKCGASLIEAQVVPEPPWWKRIFTRKKKVLKAGERNTRADGTLKDGRGFGRGLKKVFKIIVAIVVLLFIIAYIGPWRGTVNDKLSSAYHKVKRVFIAEYVPLHADAIDATSALPDHPASMAIDGATNFSWEEAVPGDGEGQKLILTFNKQVNIDQIGIRAGVSNKQDEFLKQPRPSGLHIVFSDGSSKDLKIKDTPNFQNFKVKAHAVVRMEMTVTTVYTSFEGGHDMGIAEVELFTRK